MSLHGQLSKERIAIYDKYLKHTAPRKPRPWEERTQPRLSREVLRERRESLRGYLWALANSDVRGSGSGVCVVWGGGVMLFYCRF